MQVKGKQETEDQKHIEFEAAVARVQTMADGGLRVVLDLPEDKVFEAAWLMECKRQSATITARFTVSEQKRQTVEY